MSTKPRMKLKMRVKSSNGEAGPSTASSSKSVKSVDAKPAGGDVMDYFILSNKTTFASKTAVKIQREREAAKVAPVTQIVDSDEEKDESPRRGSKRRHQDSALPTAPKLKMPEWATQDFKRPPSDRSDSDHDVQLVESDESEEEDLSPRSKRARQAAKETNERRNHKPNRRAKSRSLSVTPPPELTAEELAGAREIFREQFQPTTYRRPHTPEPCDTSTDTMFDLNPELQERIRKIKAAPKHVDEGPSGRPDEVRIRVTYIRHPDDPLASAAAPTRLSFKMKRDQDMKNVFIEVANALNLPEKKIKMCYNGTEVFRLVTPDSFDDIWDTADFEAYLDTTLDYMRRHRKDSPSKPRTSIGGTRMTASSSATKTGESSDDEASVEQHLVEDKLKLSLQSASHGEKINITAKKTSTALALIKHYLGKINVTMTDAQIKKKGIRLQFDGENIDYEDTVGDIEDGELEGGECLDIVGL